MSRRRLFARIALGAALAAAVWTIVLIIFGGFDTSILGIRVRTSDPFRPFLIAVTAVLMFVAAVGDDRTDTEMESVLDVVARTLSRIDLRLPAIILAVAIVIVGLTWSSKAAGGSDSYGYISQAELWLNGRLEITQPWVEQVPWPNAEGTFSPLGYRAGRTRTTITPTYSAGLPMMMALAKVVAGHCAIFWIVPLSGGVFVLAIFGIGRRVGGDPAGLVAAWLLATSPSFLYMLLQPMSDIPAAAAWMVAFWCITSGTIGGAIAGGLAATLAVLIRPNLAPLASILALWFILEWRAKGPDRQRYLRQGAAFLAALLPGVAVTAALNAFWNGSPFVSGYGTFADIFSFRNFLANAGNYAAWLSETQTPLAFVGIAAFFAPARWLWPDVRQSTVLVCGLFVAGVWLEYCAYLTFGAWLDLRFLLPAIGLMMVGLAVALLRLTRTTSGPMRGRRLVIALAVAFVVIMLGRHGVQFATREAVFDQQRWEMKYPIVSALVAARTEPNAVIFSSLHSGSLRYYAGRMTLAYLSLDPAWLDRTISWLDAHGAHPYAVLEASEVNEFKERFSSANGAGRLEMTPSVFYDGLPKIYLFDLLRPAGPATKMETITDPWPTVRCVPPVAPPVLAIK
jgi:4-amino-4-deoxy-L-arabinose transferase-like glycosyltransferase